MEFNADILQPENLPDIISFGTENDGIKSITFNGAALDFISSDEAINIVNEIILNFTGDSIKSIAFRDNGMSNDQINSFYHSFNSQS